MGKNIKKQGANLTLKIMLTSILPIILIGTMAYVAMNQVRDYVADSLVQKMMKIATHDLGMAFSGGATSAQTEENQDKEYTDEERGDVLGNLKIAMDEVKDSTGAEYVMYYNATPLINTFESDISEVEGVGAISDDILAGSIETPMISIAALALSSISLRSRVSSLSPNTSETRLPFLGSRLSRIFSVASNPGIRENS